MTEQATEIRRDPSRDILRWERQPLDAIFRPRSVAVVGATDRAASVGRAVMENLLRGPLREKVYAINPHRSEILGARAFPRIADLPERVDLTVIATPAATVPGIVRECVEAGIPGAVVISAGFKESGEEGRRLEEEIRAAMRGSPLRLIGPNCLGVMNPMTGLNATFARDSALVGSVAFLSQSGALCTGILDWSLGELLGFSAFVSTGSMLDVGWGDLIYYFGDDPNTRSILIYMESVGEARAFLSAAREVAMTKPVILIKAGRTEAAAKAAASHTGALAESAEVLDAALRRCGVLRVKRIAELFEIADVLGKQPRPAGPRLAIVTNAGGPGVLATDMLLESGGELAPLSQATLDGLSDFLAPHWSHGNPVDVLGDADAKVYGRAVAQVAADPNADGLLVILAPQAMTDPAAVARCVASSAAERGIPILASWMGGERVAEGAALLNRAGIPNFMYPDAAARAFTYLWQHAQNLRGLQETPTLPIASDTVNRRRATQLVEEALAANRTLLSEWESKELLAAYGIPAVPTEIALDARQAAAAAERLGFPVVVKLHSFTLTHKTDVGGVALDLRDAAEVRQAFARIRQDVSERAGAEHFKGVTVQPMVKSGGCELIIGSSVDPQFGPVLLFGLGGQLVEYLRDQALGLPPLTTTLARRLMERTKVYRVLQGARGRAPVDMAAMESLLVRFSQLVCEQPRIKEMEINPLVASGEGIAALDARVVLFPAATPEHELPRPAIRPYPLQYVFETRLRDATPVRIRPIRPEDEPGMVQFHEKLSERTVYMRYLQVLRLDRRVAHDRLTRICFIDYDREMALVAEHSGSGEILGVGRLSRSHSANRAEIAVLVRDDWQGKGLGKVMLLRLLEVARKEGIERLEANFHPLNFAMHKLAVKEGFRIEQAPEDELVRASLELTRTNG
jgi:acetyltransferase